MPDGIIIIDKPTGWTSMDVCAKLRGILREKRIGHAGTLDPMATGVLVIGIGKATKLLTWVSGHSKEYLATIRFGIATNTDDADRVRADFRAIRAAFELLKPRIAGLRDISMGMTDDHLIAIEEGSTMVRIGTEIFGPRQY